MNKKDYDLPINFSPLSTKHGDNHIIVGINCHAESKNHECKIEYLQM